MTKAEKSRDEEFDDSYLDSIEDFDEDISMLDALEIGDSSAIEAEDMSYINLDVPVYRLSLLYSKETFHAIWTESSLNPGDMVLIPTRYGRDLAKILGRVEKNSSRAPTGIIRIERIAKQDDIAKAAAHREHEREAIKICRERITDRRLDMKLVSVHYLLEEMKILFFFTAENRVDFRELVKDLTGIFKSRIELRQIGVRDESRVLGGLGICGRGCCCHTVSDKLKPVSIKMAKDQNLSLNAMKISGPCGRLLCCLAYEHQFYNEQRRLLPIEGTKINWDGVSWKVNEVNVAAGKVRLSGEDGRMVQIPGSSFEKIDNRWVVK